MNKSDVGLLIPGTRVQMGSRWLGNELYGGGDPDNDDAEWNAILNSVVTVKKVQIKRDHIEVYIEELDSYVFMEEIDHIVDPVMDDTLDLAQSDVPLSILY